MKIDRRITIVRTESKAKTYTTKQETEKQAMAEALAQFIYDFVSGEFIGSVVEVEKIIEGNK